MEKTNSSALKVSHFKLNGCSNSYWKIKKIHSLNVTYLLLNLVFLVSGASYKASYKTLFQLVCLTQLSLRAKSYKTDAKEVSYEASYVAPLNRKTRL